jgi:hypothetical protein
MADAKRWIDKGRRAPNQVSEDRVALCKTCMRYLLPDQPRSWSTRPLGLVHANPDDCRPPERRPPRSRVY